MASNWPWCMTATRSTRPRTTSMWCSTMSTVRPDRCTWRMTSTRPGTSAEPTPAMGSSSRMTWGSVASSIAISSLRLSPCESTPASVAWWWARPTSSSRSLATRVASSVARGKRMTDTSLPRATCAASLTFSSALSAGNRLEVWKVRPRPARARRWIGSAVTSLPWSFTVPSVGRSTPEIRLNRVVLPAPLGPITPSSSPCVTAIDTSSMMRAPPICRPRCSTASTGWLVIVYPWVRWLLDNGWSHGLRVDFLDQLRLPAGAIGDKLGLVHRLDHGVVFSADGGLTLRPGEGPAFEGLDHLVDVVSAAFRDGAHDHERRVEPVWREQVGLVAVRLEVLDHRLVLGRV